MSWSKEQVAAEYTKACAEQAAQALEVEVLEARFTRASNKLRCTNEKVEKLRAELIQKTLEAEAK